MLLYGAWIPQEVARSAGGGELLLEASAAPATAASRNPLHVTVTHTRRRCCPPRMPQSNFNGAMSQLRINYTSLDGSGFGGGYRAFLAWAKQQLKRGKGVVEVAFIRGDQYTDCEWARLGTPVAGRRPWGRGARETARWPPAGRLPRAAPCPAPLPTALFPPFLRADDHIMPLIGKWRMYGWLGG